MKSWKETFCWTIRNPLIVVLSFWIIFTVTVPISTIHGAKMFRWTMQFPPAVTAIGLLTAAAVAFAVVAVIAAAVLSTIFLIIDSTGKKNVDQQ